MAHNQHSADKLVAETDSLRFLNEQNFLNEHNFLEGQNRSNARANSADGTSRSKASLDSSNYPQELIRGERDANFGQIQPELVKQLRDAQCRNLVGSKIEAAFGAPAETSASYEGNCSKTATATAQKSQAGNPLLRPFFAVAGFFASYLDATLGECFRFLRPSRSTAEDSDSESLKRSRRRSPRKRTATIDGIPLSSRKRRNSSFWIMECLQKQREMSSPESRQGFSSVRSVRDRYVRDSFKS